MRFCYLAVLAATVGFLVISCISIMCGSPLLEKNFEDASQSTGPDASSPGELPHRDPEQILRLQTTAKGKRFYCLYAMNTESSCRLFVSDVSGLTITDLAISISVPNQALLVSPGEQSLLVILEHAVYLIDSQTLAIRLVATTTEAEIFGTYTSLPAFRPVARWLDESQIELSIFGLELSRSMIKPGSDLTSISPTRRVVLSLP